MPNPGKQLGLKVRLLRRIKLDDVSGCWLWTGSLHAGGYGWIGKGRHDSGNYLTHRASWMVHKGDIPSGMNVLHRCDNPPCVNPDHLFLGTQSDNINDMDSKGRRVTPCKVGESNPHSKLTTEMARAIKTSKEKTRFLVKRYGISRTVVQRIRSGNNWKHL